MSDIKSQFKKLMSQCIRCADKITLIIGGVLIIIYLVFLYNNFYKTINDTKVLLILKDQVLLEVVDMELWKKINKEIEWKEQPLAEEGLERNPFE